MSDPLEYKWYSWARGPRWYGEKCKHTKYHLISSNVRYGARLGVTVCGRSVYVSDVLNPPVDGGPIELACKSCLSVRGVKWQTR